MKIEDRGGRIAWLVVVILLLIFIVLLGEDYSKKLLGFGIPSEAEYSTLCDLSKNSCEKNIVELNGRYLFDLSPRPIKSRERLTLTMKRLSPIMLDDTAVVTNPKDQGIVSSLASENEFELVILGESMAMGVHRYTFEQINNESYQATFILPLCASHRMAWEAVLSINLESQSILVPMRFTSTN